MKVSQYKHRSRYLESVVSNFIDLHAHLNMLEATPKEVLAAAKENNVNKVITIGTGPEDNKLALQLAKENFPKVQCCLGAHPHDAKDFTADEEQWLLQQYDTEFVIGVGEIGLDYYYNNSPQDIQRDVFRRMLEISVEKSMPVQIHTRDAEPDTVEILKEFNSKVTGIIHCFTGTQWLADEVLKLGLNISFSGIVTFKSANELRSVLESVPLDRLHVETDSPFLTPMPHRGKKNEPKYVIHTAELISEIKKVSLSELSRITNENAKRVFPKIIL